MSTVRLGKVTPPSAPAASKIEIFSDINDVGRLKYIDGDTGLTRILASTEWPRNLLANGGFDLCQRQAPGLTTYSQVASRQYAADRWFLSNENASLQFQQVSTLGAYESGLSSAYYGKYKKITSAGKFQIGQVISGRDAAQLRGKRVRLSAKMKRTVAGAMTVRMAVLEWTGTQDGVSGYVAGLPSGTFVSAWQAAGTDPTHGVGVARIAPVANTAEGGTIVGNAVQCVLSGNWTRYSACFDLPNTSKNYIVLIWTDGQPAAGDELNVSEVNLTEGPEIIDWVGDDYEGNLDACNRYYSKSFLLGTTPAGGTGGQGALRGFVSVAGAVLFTMGAMYFPVRMRIAPNIVLFNPDAANAFVRNTVAGTDSTTAAAANQGESGADVTCTGLAAWTVGQILRVHWTADAEL